MKTYRLNNLTVQERRNLRQRPRMAQEEIFPAVRSILDQVKKEGDKALLGLTERFDRVKLASLKIPAAAFEEAEKVLSKELKDAFRRAAKNIEKFHTAQMRKEKPVEVTLGVRCFRESRPIQKVGLYIPGGTAPLPSTVLMLGIPACIAGCEKVILCTPPNKTGEVPPEILFAAELAGVQEVYRVGGAQAIGAMAYGTETIPQVDKIFGPGNQYVTAAKMIVSNDLDSGVAIDMPAGPSEVLVIADENADPKFIAADLLSQAEHGPDSQVVFITPAEGLIPMVQFEIEQQLQILSRRAIAERALENSLLIVSASLEEGITFSNEYAPEHLILNVRSPERYVASIANAGSVFLGPWSPESVGDYASGTNHTLPTYGYARNYSGVSIDSFVKKITFQKLNKQGLKSIGPTVEQMAECEGLTAHKNAVSIRLLSL